MKRLLEKYKSLSVVAKAPIWYAFCSILQRCISFFTMPFFTNLLTTEQYGLFSVYQSWMGILLIFTTLNLQYGVFNNAMVRFEDKRDEYISSMQGLVLLLNVLFLGVYWLFREQWNHLFGLSTALVLVMSLEMLMMPSLAFWSGKKRFEFKYREVIAVTLVMSLVNPVICMIAVMASEDRGIARIVSAAIINFVFYLAFFIWNTYKGKKLYVKKYWKYALSFNIPLIPYYLSQIVFNQSDRIMIDHMVGTDKAGIYSVVSNCAMIIVFIITAINNAFVPWTYHKLKEQAYSKLSKVSNLLSVFIAAILLLVMIVSPEIIRIMAAPEYYEGIWTMPPIICSLFFLFQSQLFINVEFYKEKKSYLVYGSILSALLNIVLNYIFIPIAGYIAAGYTTLLAYIVFAASNYYFMCRIMKKEQANTKIYDIRFLSGLSIVMITASGLILATYQSIWIRVGLFLMILSVGFVNRKKLIEGLKILSHKEETL